MALYTRVLFSTILSILASRYILAALGIQDFGLFCVILGIMGSLSFLNNAMTTSTQRQLAHALGTRDRAHLNQVFKTSIKLHTVFSFIFLLMAETLGLWFLTEILQIPPDRDHAAFWVYQFSIIGSLCVILTVPYQALLGAHEAFITVSVIGIVQSVLGFVLAMFLVHLPGDRLFGYGLLSSAILMVVTALQALFCRVKYPETRLRSTAQASHESSKAILKFSGWALIGSLSATVRFQGSAFLLNIYFGAAINAAYGIGLQISAMMNSFTQVVHQAVSPRLIKEQSVGKSSNMLNLALASSKYGFLITCLLGTPLWTEMPRILSVWLIDPPQHADTFGRIMLIVIVCDQLSSGLSNAALAIGKLAKFTILVGAIHLLTLPVAYLFMELGYRPEAVLLSSLGTMICASIIRVILMKSLAGLTLLHWFKTVVLRGVGGMAPSFIFAVFASLQPSPWLKSLFIFIPLSFLVSALGIVFIGMSCDERKRLLSLFNYIKKGCRN